MAISTGGGGDTPMSDINTTPLVDVMLVLLIIFLIAVPVAIQTIEKLEIPVFESVESKNKVENLLLTVSTTDAAGRSAGEPGFEGASRVGECRVYFNNITPVTSEQLYDQAFTRLDNIVTAAGGPEAIMEDPAAMSTHRGAASQGRSTTCRQPVIRPSGSSRTRSNPASEPTEI